MKRRQLNIGKALNWLMENAVFLVTAIVLYFRTAELLALFAPQDLLGYTGPDMARAYGYLSALLVEFVLVGAKYSLDQERDDLAWAYNVALIVVTFLISAASQVTDGLYVRNTLADQPQIVQNLVNIGVPLIPSMVLAMMAGKAIVRSAPASLFERFTAGRVSGRMPTIRVVKPDPKQLPDPDDTKGYELDVEAAALALKEMSPETKAALAGMTIGAIRSTYHLKWKDAAELARKAKAGKL